MGSGGHNVPLILVESGIRKLSPRECANFQGFPANFILPDIADSKLYHQIGNSVTVPLIEKIARAMNSAMA
jgi:DNA (cytosine-5)-methyltransferase 1